MIFAPALSYRREHKQYQTVDRRPCIPESTYSERQIMDLSPVARLNQCPTLTLSPFCSSPSPIRQLLSVPACCRCLLNFSHPSPLSPLLLSALASSPLLSPLGIGIAVSAPVPPPVP